MEIIRTKCKNIKNIFHGHMVFFYGLKLNTSFVTITPDQNHNKHTSIIRHINYLPDSRLLMDGYAYRVYICLFILLRRHMLIIASAKEEVSCSDETEGLPTEVCSLLPNRPQLRIQTSRDDPFFFL